MTLLRAVLANMSDVEEGTEHEDDDAETQNPVSWRPHWIKYPTRKRYIGEITTHFRACSRSTLPSRKSGNER